MTDRQTDRHERVLEDSALEVLVWEEYSVAT